MIEKKRAVTGATLLELMAYLAISSLLCISVPESASAYRSIQSAGECLQLRDFFVTAKQQPHVQLNLNNRYLEANNLLRFTLPEGSTVKLRTNIFKHGPLSYSPQRIIFNHRNSSCELIVSLRGRIRINRIYE